MIPKSTGTVTPFPVEIFSYSLLHCSGHVPLFLLTLLQEAIPDLFPQSLNFSAPKSEFVLVSVPRCLHLK